MTAVNIVSGILLVLASVAIILVVLFTKTDNRGVNSAIGGGSSDSFFGRNSSNTREAKLDRITKVIVAIFFVVAIVCTVLARFFGEAA
ncbi:MAG TPA: preprotein translocase subunit SecG [Candidatus Faeciplasma gallinarum]|uniref:Protein-export membrane protein SecG n=1 Tax=Candidatus Faeciplasma gallinarum TaxID=2840799 RepID=A0A9D1EQ46_9FIRM|nr:preprotein translocase subunit SecG [Candidatus Faeciplasma gallinarum]